MCCGKYPADSARFIRQIRDDRHEKYKGTDQKD